MRGAVEIKMMSCTFGQRTMHACRLVKSGVRQQGPCMHARCYLHVRLWRSGGREETGYVIGVGYTSGSEIRRRAWKQWLPVKAGCVTSASHGYSVITEKILACV